MLEDFSDAGTSRIECFHCIHNVVYLPSYPLGAGAELKGDVVVGLREITGCAVVQHCCKGDQ